MEVSKFCLDSLDTQNKRKYRRLEIIDKAEVAGEEREWTFTEL